MPGDNPKRQLANQGVRDPEKDYILALLRLLTRTIIPLVLVWVVGQVSVLIKDGIETGKSATDFIFRALFFLVGSLAIARITSGLIHLRSTALRKQQGPPFEGFDYCVPDAHWYFGHLQLLGSENFFTNTRKLCVENASPFGVTTFWNKHHPTVTFTRKAEVEKVFRYSFERMPLPWIEYHWRALLGKKSLILTYGKEWMANRALVHKAFVPSLLRYVQQDICRIAFRAVQAIVQKIDKEGLYGSDVSTTTNSTAVRNSSNNKTLLLDILSLYRMVLLDIFGVTTMGHDFQCFASSTLSPHWVIETFSYLSDEMNKRCYSERLNPAAQLYWIPTLRNLRHRRENERLRDFLSSIVSERVRKHQASKTRISRNGPKTRSQTDLLGQLIHACTHGRNSRSGAGVGHLSPLNSENLCDFLVTLLYGGFDTTSVALSYATYLLAMNPKHEERCYEEVIHVLGPSPNLPTPSEPPFDPVKELSYCHAVLIEAMRLYPPVPYTVRALGKPITTSLPSGDDNAARNDNQYTFPVGTRVMLFAWWSHRNPDNFPLPSEFLPERWVERAETKRSHREDQSGDGSGCPRNVSSWSERTPPPKNHSLVQEEGRTDSTNMDNDGCPAGDRDALFTFSGGGRSCVGKRYAMQEAVTVLALFIREMHIKVPPEYKLQPKRLGVMQQPSKGLPVLLSRRRSFKREKDDQERR